MTRMKRIIVLGLGVSCFASLGNGQESGTGTVQSIQGNVAWNRHLDEQDLKRATTEARRMKELKHAMAAQAPAQVVYTTANDFLAANRTPTPPPSEERPEPRRGSSYVPDFESSQDGPVRPGPDAGQVSSPSNAGSSGDLSTKDRKLFGWFRGKKNNQVDGSQTAPVGAAEYQNPYEQQGIETSDEATSPGAPVSEPPSPEQAEANREAVLAATNQGASDVDLPSGGSQQGLFKRLFGRENSGQEPANSLMPSTSDPVEPGQPYPADGFQGGEAAEEMAVAGNETSGGLPEPPSFDEEPAPATAPPEEPEQPSFATGSEAPGGSSSIFVNRGGGNASGGEAAQVRREGYATVNGVRVKLYAGSQVAILNTHGRDATIQLPDGRIGTTNKSLLKR